jgi:hypothetical protein
VQEDAWGFPDLGLFTLVRVTVLKIDPIVDDLAASIHAHNCFLEVKLD